MKFDRQRPSHWLRAAWLSFVLVLSSLVAWLLPRNRQNVIVLSGHALTGNLLALSKASAFSDPGIKWFYVAMSESTVPKQPGIAVLRLWRIPDGVKLARARIVITDHGPGLLVLLQRLRPRVMFVDVWHGVGFKALGPVYAAGMRRYLSVIAASPWDAENQFRTAGVRQDQIEIFGYCLMDEIVVSKSTGAGLSDGHRPRLLVAPTWFQSDSDDLETLTDSRLIRALGKWANDRGWDVIVRAHLNAPEIADESSNVHFMGMASFPDTVQLMIESDVLLTDWSSIANDFHGLRRPVVFWDRSCPFSDLRMAPQDRVGPVASSVDELLEVLDTIASDEGWFIESYGSEQRELLERVHESGLDGRACTRLVEFLSTAMLT
jgi:CDP-glycerol glycerophosphotransferase (TagB/SpsB family)